MIYDEVLQKQRLIKIVINMIDKPNTCIWSICIRIYDKKMGWRSNTQAILHTRSLKGIIIKADGETEIVPRRNRTENGFLNSAAW